MMRHVSKSLWLLAVHAGHLLRRLSAGAVGDRADDLSGTGERQPVSRVRTERSSARG